MHQYGSTFIYGRGIGIDNRMRNVLYGGMSGTVFVRDNECVFVSFSDSHRLQKSPLSALETNLPDSNFLCVTFGCMPTGQLSSQMNTLPCQLQ